MESSSLGTVQKSPLIQDTSKCGCDKWLSLGDRSTGNAQPSLINQQMLIQCKSSPLSKGIEEENMIHVGTKPNKKTATCNTEALRLKMVNIASRKKNYQKNV